MLRQIAAVLLLECADVCRNLDVVVQRLYEGTSWHKQGCMP